MNEHLEGLDPKQTSVAVDIHVCYIQNSVLLTTGDSVEQEILNAEL